MKGIVPTEKWFIALQDYSTQLFAGKDFIELKAMYITAYFNGNIDAYNTFAGKNFYANQLKYSPPNEYPFLGEIKVPGNITCNYILSA